MAEAKSHKPTFKRLRKAREDGRTVKSTVVTSAAALSGCYFGVYQFGEGLWFNNQILLQYLLVQGFDTPDEMLLQFVLLIVRGVLTVLGLVALFAILAEVRMVGFQIELKPLSPNFSRVNPVSGFQRIGSGIKEIWLTALFMLLLVIALAILLFWVGLVPPGLAGGTLTFLQRSFARAGALVATAGCLVFCAAGAIEYLWKRNQFMRELSMSADDLRREHKESEGDPQFRALRRSKHRELAQQDLVKQVRAAKVIIVERAR
jgi:flagellar biosynthesis protein FlhB